MPSSHTTDDNDEFPILTDVVKTDSPAEANTAQQRHTNEDDTDTQDDPVIFIPAARRLDKPDSPTSAYSNRISPVKESHTLRSQIQKNRAQKKQIQENPSLENQAIHNTRPLHMKKESDLASPGAPLEQLVEQIIERHAKQMRYELLAVIKLHG